MAKELKPDDKPTYVERNRGNLKTYLIRRGKHARFERLPSGEKVLIQYTHDAEDSRKRVIELTEAGAASMNNLKLEEVSSREAKAKPAKRVKVPKNWENLSKAKRLALAAALSDRPMSDEEEAAQVIRERLEQEAEDAAGEADSE